MQDRKYVDWKVTKWKWLGCFHRQEMMVAQTRVVAMGIKKNEELWGLRGKSDLQYVVADTILTLWTTQQSNFP